MKAFPFDEVAPWPLSQRYLLHALECVTHIKQQHMAFFEAAHLLNNVGVYFYSRGQYEDVEPLFQQAQYDYGTGKRTQYAQHCYQSQ